MRCFLRQRMYSLWGSTLAENHQLPSGDYAVAQGMFYIAYQCHRRNTMCIEKRSAANGAQRNPSIAKVHHLSCKIVSRDSPLIATNDNCNQAQVGPPTRSPSKMFHKKTAFTRMFLVRDAPSSQNAPTATEQQRNGFSTGTR